MSISWVNFSVEDFIDTFSLSLESNDFLFLSGDTHLDKLIRSLSGFFSDNCSFESSIRIDGQGLKKDNMFKTLFLPENATEMFPKHKTIGQFALGLSGITKEELEAAALKLGIEKNILHSKPHKISLTDKQKISLWLCSLKKSTAIFIEEPESGFCEECRPFNLLQNILKFKTTDYIIYSTSNKDIIEKKSYALQFCRVRLAIFYADRLIEEGIADRIINNPIHPYTKNWLEYGCNLNKRIPKSNKLWENHCTKKCKNQNECLAMLNKNYNLWDHNADGLHKSICKNSV